jgi:hypothetical protein
MRYRLRTLVILMAIVPPILAMAYWLVMYVPRPKNYAEAFTCFLVCFNLTFVGWYIATRVNTYLQSKTP